jgi:small subunit ribosomal protein S18
MAFARSKSKTKTKRRRSTDDDRRYKRKSCRFCADKIAAIDYKDSNRLRNFVTERGKIVPRRITGNCSRHQHILTKAIKRARVTGLLPFVAA